MKLRILVSTILCLVVTLGEINAQAASAKPPIMVQDFERDSSLPQVWVVNIPNENASVKLSKDDPHDGKQCLKLHYHFVAMGGFQYLGVPNKVKVNGPIHHLHYWLNGDNSKCSYGVRLTDASGQTHQFPGGNIDFKGWKEVTINLDSRHETWGGDNNGKIDYPVGEIIFTVGQPTEKADGKEKQLPTEGDLSFDSLSVDSEKEAAEILGGQVSVLAPDYCSDVKGDVAVKLSAPGFRSVTVKCWKQGEGFGSDSTVATVPLDGEGTGSFIFPAEQYPHGPITVRIHGENGALKDNCYLQLYNKGGVAWGAGLPKDPPPAAKDMSLVFADDFTGPLSIGKDPKATYFDHKPPNGWQDFSVHRFSDFHSPLNPFAQVDTYLRIRASDKVKSAGLICSAKSDGFGGINAKAPCYFECRFIGPNAIGTWPAFWLLTAGAKPEDKTHGMKGGDELDIIEAYGGEGPHEPNAFDTYMISPHCWDQGAAGKALETKAYQGMHNPARMHKLGIPSTWFEAFHTYACKITETDTSYYCDDIEVGRHATFPLSKDRPFYFLIDLGTGGGWPVNISRYGTVDMYVDYVRVYQGKR